VGYNIKNIYHFIIGEYNMPLFKRRGKHSPAGMRYLKAEKKRKEQEAKKKKLKKVTSYNYYGGANKRRKTADELLKEIKSR
jgi:hypothetical protein